MDEQSESISDRTSASEAGGDGVRERSPRARGTERHDRRSDARERALYALYEASVKEIEPSEVLAAQVIPPDELTRELVTGVAAQRRRLDAAIGAKSRGWALERMPVIDLNVLRLGAFELAARPDVPVAVVIDEAVALAKRFSTDNSGRFVNGVLSALAPELRAEVQQG
jgi:N utilization substance protein B